MCIETWEQVSAAQFGHRLRCEAPYSVIDVEIQLRSTSVPFDLLELVEVPQTRVSYLYIG
jgi:hypothetical protein